MNKDSMTIGPVAFFILLIVGVVGLWNIVDYSDPEVVRVSLFLVLSFALMSMMRPRLELGSRIQNQFPIILLGLYGAAGLLITQLILSPFTYSSLPVALYAAIGEEAFFTGFAYVGLRRILKINIYSISFFLGIAFATFHAIVYNLTLPMIIVLLVGRMIMYWAFEQTNDFGTPLISHLIVNILATGIDFSYIYVVMRTSVGLIVLLFIFMVVVRYVR